MSTTRIPAVFIRGGTSKGVFFHAHDLPTEQAARDRIFLEVLGSPDPYQRQLNGMGGGISSLSKAVIVEPSIHPDADVDYTFAQVAVDQAVVDYATACGNLSSAVGAFAVDEKLVQRPDGEVTVRVFSTNAQQIYHAHFRVESGQAAEEGDFAMSGVAGTGAPVRLEYLSPGGAITGQFLPSAQVQETIETTSFGAVQVSLVDATNPVVFLAADAVGIAGTELPDALETIPGLLDGLDELRRIAGVRMGMATSPQDVPLGNPKLAILSAPHDYVTLDGKTISADQHDLGVRMVSMQRIHRAVTGTGAMCLGAAVQISGGVAAGLARHCTPGTPLRIGSPSGVLEVDASVACDSEGQWDVRSITVFRTQRRLMEGWVRVRSSQA